MRNVVVRQWAVVGCLIGALSVSTSATADAAADAFANIFAHTCLLHVANLDELRNKLKDVTELPPEKAKYFLHGMEGRAWPVPDRRGVFVVSIAKDTHMCSVFARRLDAKAAQEQFVRLVGRSPAPWVSNVVKDESRQDSKNGLMKTLGYEWTAPQAVIKTVYMLTTASADSANMQGLATANLSK